MASFSRFFSALGKMKLDPTAPITKSTASVRNQCTLQNYIDYADEDERDSRLQYNSLASNQNSYHQFPVKLHYMLGEVEKDGISHVVSWQPHGRCFIVRDQEEFVKMVLPNWFRQSKFASFQRQLNLYGFRRLTHGIDKGGYYHELFLRGKQSLSMRIMRTKVKGNGPRRPYTPESEPNFYCMKSMPCTLGEQNANFLNCLENPSSNAQPAPDNRAFVSLPLTLKLPTPSIQIFEHFNPPDKNLYMGPTYIPQQIMNSPLDIQLSSMLNMEFLGMATQDQQNKK